MPALQEILNEDIAKYGYPVVDKNLRTKYGIGIKDVASSPELMATSLENWTSDPQLLITTHIPSARTGYVAPLIDESLYQQPTAPVEKPAPRATWSLAEGIKVEDPDVERVRDVFYQEAAKYGRDVLDKHLQDKYGVSFAQIQEVPALLNSPFSEWKADPQTLIKKHIFKEVPVLGISLPQTAEELAAPKAPELPPPVDVSYSIPHTIGRIGGTVAGLVEGAAEVGKQGAIALYESGAGRKPVSEDTVFDTSYNQVLQHIRERKPKEFFSAETFQNLVDDVGNNVAGLATLVSFPLGFEGRPETSQTAIENVKEGLTSGREFGKGLIGGATGGFYGLMESFVKHPRDTFAAQPATVLLTIAPVLAKIPIREIPASLRPIVSRITRTLGEVAPEAAANLATPHAIPAESFIRESLAKKQRAFVTPVAMAEPAQSIIAREVLEGGRAEAATTRQAVRGALHTPAAELIPPSRPPKIPMPEFGPETPVAPEVPVNPPAAPEVPASTAARKAALIAEREALATTVEPVVRDLTIPTAREAALADIEAARLAKRRAITEAPPQAEVIASESVESLADIEATRLAKRKKIADVVKEKGIDSNYRATMDVVVDLRAEVAKAKKNLAILAEDENVAIIDHPGPYTEKLAKQINKLRKLRDQAERLPSYEEALVHHQERAASYLEDLNKVRASIAADTTPLRDLPRVSEGRGKGRIDLQGALRAVDEEAAAKAVRALGTTPRPTPTATVSVEAALRAVDEEAAAAINALPLEKPGTTRAVSKEVAGLTLERNTAVKEAALINKRVADLQALISAKRAAGAGPAVTDVLEVRLGKAQVAANKIATKVSKLDGRLSQTTSAEEAAFTKKASARKAAIDKELEAIDVENAKAAWEAQALDTSPGVRGARKIPFDEATPEIPGEQLEVPSNFPAVYGTSPLAGVDEFIRILYESDVPRAPRVLHYKYNAATRAMTPMVWEDLLPEETAFLENKGITRARFNDAPPMERATLLQGASEVARYPTDPLLDNIIKKTGRPEIAERVYAAASEDSFSKLTDKKYRKAVVKNIASGNSLSSGEIVALDKHLAELGEAAASGKPVVGVVSLASGERIFLTDYVNAKHLMKSFGAKGPKAVVAQKFKYVSMAADALAQEEATLFVGKTLRETLDNIGGEVLSESMRDRGIALLKLVKSGRPLPIMVDNAADIAGVLGSDIRNLATEVGLSPEAVTRVSRELAHYSPISSELKAVIPDSATNAFAAPGFDSIMRSQIAVQNAIAGRGLNSFIKLNLTGRNLLSAVNNFMANTVIEHMSTGDPTSLVKIARTTSEFLKWRKNVSSVSPENARAFSALNSTGLIESGRLESELGLMVRKRWGPLAPVSKALETVYNWGDQVFKLNTGFRNFPKVMGDIEGLADGASHTLLVTPELRVRVTRAGDLFKADFLSTDGRIIRTSTGPSTMLDPIVARASLKPALDKYFDLSDVPSHVKWIRSVPWVGIVSPFYSWFYRSVMIPGIKGGIPGALLTETYPIISSSSWASTAKNFGRAVATTIRRGMILNAAQNIIPNKEAADIFNKMFTFNPSSGPALVAFLGFNSARTKDISAWNSFAPTMTAFDLAFSLGSPVDAERGLQSLTAEVEALDDKSIPLDEKLNLIRRREFWMQRLRGEKTPLNAAFTLAGAAGGPLLNIIASVRESQKKGLPVDYKFLTNTAGIALLGGTYWRTLQAGVPAIAGWGDPDTYLANGGWSLGSSRALAAGNPSTGEQDYLGWYFSQLVGVTAYKSSIAIHQDYYLKGKKVSVKGFIDFAVDGATTELKKNLEKEKDLRVVNLITHGYVDEAEKLKTNIDTIKAYIDGLNKLEKDIYYRKGKQLGMF